MIFSKLLSAGFYVLFATSSLALDRNELYKEQLAKINFASVRQDLATLLTTSNPEFPADYGNYGPFFIRSAWHCAGSYRASDGEGGCDGGRIRFEPEQSWDDNTNLDKARKLLRPIKEKYGLGLSWGDLIVLAGTVAIEEMGAPHLGFCAGRVDDLTGAESVILGPSDSQRETEPCPVNGNCTSPLGPTTVQLIYVNPEGFLGVPEPENTVNPIRDTFGRMGMNDSETVALIGGGHAFGKAHGACPNGPGPKPNQQPENPWPGECGTGKGADTVTSGFEGPWTSTPTKFTNSYFRALLNFNFERHVGPGGHFQWKINETGLSAPPPKAPVAHGEGTQDLMMLTADLALLEDPSYKAIVELFAGDVDVLAHAFIHAWYKLTTRDMGPVSRCFGNDIPPVQEFQAPLPPPPTSVADFKNVQEEIKNILFSSSTELVSDNVNGLSYNGAWLIELAYLCAATFRTTDHAGGCNGARVRLAPEKDWEDRKGMDKVLSFLNPVKSKFNSAVLTNADLIVFAGSAALFEASTDPSAKVDLKFCPGRSDAVEAPVSPFLKLFRYADKALELRRQARLFGLPVNKFSTLMARPRSAEYMKLLGYSGSYTSNPSILSNQYFKTLLSETWTKIDCGTNCSVFGAEYRNADGTKFITQLDFTLTTDAEFLAATIEYAADNTLFLNDFGYSWTKLMNADRFDGPVDNLCTNGKVDLVPLGDIIVAPTVSPTNPASLSMYGVGTFVALMASLLLVVV